MIPARWFVFSLLLIGAGCVRGESAPVHPPALPPSGFAATSTKEGTVLPIATVPFLDAATEQAGWAHLHHQTTPCSPVRAGLVNHHTLAPELIAGFFAELARCRKPLRTKTIILLSPDHWARGQDGVTVHELPYQVGASLVEVDEAAVQRLQSAVPGVRLDGEAFRGEHGVGALVPFAARVFPSAKIVPIMVRQTTDAQTGAALATWVRDELKHKETIVVVSSDLSHYLPAETALQNDEETRASLRKGDADFFWSATDTHTDNGKSLSILIQALGSTKWRELEHAISSDYGGSRLFTTSYVTGVWEAR